MLRFAPSPTGFLHFGNIRVALLNFLFAKKNKLNFFLRIDDTDKERSKDEFTSSIVEDLKWLGIEYFKVIKQSERLEKYKDIFKFLKNKNLIYPCFESSDELSFKRKILLKQGKPPIYDRSSLNLTKSEIASKIQSGINPYWRLKLDERPIEWNDLIHGKITFNNLSVSDPVIFRSDEMPLFTITSVVDDAEMRVSHVFRGDDHITNTAAQIKLFKSIDASIPDFGHFPLIKSKTGEGLSKRSNSLSISVDAPCIDIFIAFHFKVCIGPFFPSPITISLNRFITLILFKNFGNIVTSESILIVIGFSLDPLDHSVK